MGDLGKDIRHALQMFFKSPGFTIAAVAALSLGIGANTAIFTVVNAVLLKPLTYPNADRIVEIELTGPDGNNAIASIPKFHVYQQQTGIFKEVAAYDFAGPGYNLTGDRPEQIHGIHVTEAYFRLFGAPVMLGRTFTPQEDRGAGGKVRGQHEHHAIEPPGPAERVSGSGAPRCHQRSGPKSEPPSASVRATSASRAFCLMTS